MERLGVIDVGSESARMLVADVGAGTLRKVERQATVTRLAEGIDVAGRLAAAPRARALDAVDDFVARARELGCRRIAAVLTSAARDAVDGAAFAGEIGGRHGIPARILDEAAEARLSFAGATHGRALAGPVLVVDLGGRSTELAIGDGAGLRSHSSAPVGAVRHSELPLDLAGVSSMVRDQIGAAVARMRPELAAAVSGGLLTADSRQPGRAGALSRAQCARALRRLEGMSVDDRRAVPGLDPGRAESVVAGAVILVAVMDAFGLTELEHAAGGVLEGVALELSMGPAPSVS